jgi:hypothetical protein
MTASAVKSGASLVTSVQLHMIDYLLSLDHRIHVQTDTSHPAACQQQKTKIILFIP